MLVRGHGAQAAARVAARIEELAGNIEGRTVWERIGRAVDGLLAQGPDEGNRMQLVDGPGGAWGGRPRGKVVPCEG